ncbi:hypothetical protein Cgig2_029212 [Carnegiea gigantea]|uniref:TLDc domain-containing protein n=1 Tax=Carnegiea gigantea TaxID=171969 RepID=A0A9Q1QJK6_9CARY|nr:hypothetical protein Cgig2_029212 [Carnegiea gigantea]
MMHAFMEKVTSKLSRMLIDSPSRIYESNQGSTLRDGISFRTLMRKSAALSGPGLLIVGDRKGAVFGGLLDCPLKPCPRRKYQGTNQTFVFTNIYGEPRLFRATGANRYFYLCLNDMIAFGGGSNFALSLDGDLLNGSSGPCETFGNLCLAHDSMFELKNVEVLSLIPQMDCLVNLGCKLVSHEQGMVWEQTEEDWNGGWYYLHLPFGLKDDGILLMCK